MKNAYNNIKNHAKILKKIATNTQKNAIRKEGIKLNIKYKKNSRKVNVSSTSLNNKFDDFKAQVFIKKPHVIYVCETWWDDTSVKNLDGYILFSKDREGRGG